MSLTPEEAFVIEQQNFAARIKQLKELFGINQKQLAARAGLAEITIRRVEKADANFEFRTLSAVANGFHLSLYSLLNYSNEQPHPDEYTPDAEARFLQEKRKLGDRLYSLCHFRGMDQETLGVLAGKGNSFVSDCLNGKQNLVFRNMFQFALSLEVPLSMIFDYNGPMPTNRFIGKLPD